MKAKILIFMDKSWKEAAAIETNPMSVTVSGKTYTSESDLKRWSDAQGTEISGDMGRIRFLDAPEAWLKAKSGKNLTFVRTVIEEG